MTTPIQGEANRLIDSPGLAAAVERLVEFLAGGSFTSGISRLEQELAGATTETLVGAIGSSGITQDLLAASILVRRNFGRISDVIHASAIVLTLPQVLEDGETLMRPPSLAAGNDPSRPYDLETDRRVAEFKLSEWKGTDAARKRQSSRISFISPRINRSVVASFTWWDRRPSGSCAVRSPPRAGGLIDSLSRSNSPRTGSARSPCASATSRPPQM